MVRKTVVVAGSYPEEIGHHFHKAMAHPVAQEPAQGSIWIEAALPRELAGHIQVTPCAPDSILPKHLASWTQNS